MSARSPSLRRRLVSGLVSVLAIGVIAFAAVTYVSLRSFLNHRTDTDALDLAQAGAVAVHDSLQNVGHNHHPTTQQQLSLLRRLRTLAPTGDAVAIRFGNSDGFGPSPQFPGPMSVGPERAIRLLIQMPEPDVDTSDAPQLAAPLGGGAYVSAYEYLPRAHVVVVAAISTAQDRSTLHRLLVVETASAIWLLCLLAVLSLGVVRRGLRPLDTIAATALAIAAGERGRRIPVAEGDTEIGRVSAALNRMLADNEAALRSKEDSEAQLRRFVADASHELRTPLASIRSYADLLASGAAAGPGEEQLALERIQRESVRMTRLVEDLLLLARLDTGRLLVRAPVDLSALAADAVADAQALAPDRAIKLKAAPGVTVTGDADRLAQVMTNLLSNARVHTPPGYPVDVEVRLREGTADLRIRDHGPGIPAAEAARIFDRFYRLDPSRHRAGPESGVGLGLAIVNAIVAAHGGSVHVEATPGGGATFVVRLPGGHPPEPADEETPGVLSRTGA